MDQNGLVERLGPSRQAAPEKRTQLDNVEERKAGVSDDDNDNDNDILMY